MKVSDGMLDVMDRMATAAGTATVQAWGEHVSAMVVELRALRKVAEAATSMLQMAYANGEERAKWERLMGALVEAGY